MIYFPEGFNFIVLPFSYLYRVVFCLNRRIKLNNIKPLDRSKTKIVSIGNITIGGTGKTPFVIFLAGFLKKRGKNVVVVSRGYRKGNKKHLIDTIIHKDVESGDEPWLLSKKIRIPIIVSSDKNEGCSYAIKNYAPDVLILDDGFQSFSIERDLDILLLDATDNFLNSFLIPAGRLREPLNAMKRADIIVVTRYDQVERKQMPYILRGIKNYKRSAPIFLSFHNPLFLQSASDDRRFEIGCLKGKNVLSLSSIGNNNSFLKTLTSLGLTIGYSMTFLDHHYYSRNDIRRINRVSSIKNVDAIVTTEKDIYSLSHYSDALHLPLYSLVVELCLKKQKGFEMLLKEKGLI